MYTKRFQNVVCIENNMGVYGEHFFRNFRTYRNECAIILSNMARIENGVCKKNNTGSMCQKFLRNFRTHRNEYATHTCKYGANQKMSYE